MFDAASRPAPCQAVVRCFCKELENDECLMLPVAQHRAKQLLDALQGVSEGCMFDAASHPHRAKQLLDASARS